MEESIRSQLWASQLRQYERETNVEPHARLLKVVIAGIESQQEDPFRRVHHLPDFSSRWITIVLLVERYTGKGVAAYADYHGLSSALLDSWTLSKLMERVERKDKILLREVVGRAVQSIRKALFPHGFGVPHALYILSRSVERNSNSVSASEPGSQLAFAFNAAVVAVLHLLAFVFQYLIGYVDRGGSKTFSSGAFDFRATFVSLVLFQGAYVWIKFRQADPPSSRKRNAPDTTIDDQLLDGFNRKGVYERVTPSGDVTYSKYEPRFTPPKEEVDDDPNIRSNRLSLGGHDTRVEAMIVLQIAKSYYDDNMDEGCVEFQDGPYKFSIPPMSEQARRLTGKKKRKWVESEAKRVGKRRFCDLVREMWKPESAMAVEAGPHVDHGNGAGSSGPSSCAPPLPCSSPAMLTVTADEPATVSDPPSSPNWPLVPVEAAIMRDFNYSPWGLSTFDGMMDEPCYERGLPNHPAQPSIPDSYRNIYAEFAQILGVSSSPGAVTRSIDHVSESEVRPDRNLQQRRALVAVGPQNIDGRGSSILLQQGDPVLQQVGLCEQKLPEDTAGQFADLDNRLTVCPRQNSELQKEKEFLQLENSKLRKEKERWALEKEEFRTEIERLKSRLREAAKFLSCDLD